MAPVTQLNTSFDPDVIRFEFEQIADSRGNLCPIDFDQLPFRPANMFFIFGAPPGTARGGHARRSSEQLLLCVAGVIRVAIQHRGRAEEFVLNERQAIYLKPNVWSQQTYCTSDARLLVLTSGKYEAADYSTSPTRAD
jgi:dTDP-4-dehydrorhamnose 3,5-epimerase-like enzyme